MNNCGSRMHQQESAGCRKLTVAVTAGRGKVYVML
jgi:hypothetical protein